MAANFSFERHKAELVAHYQKLVKTPGWRDYVRELLPRLAAKDKALYGDIEALVFAKPAEAQAPAAPAAPAMPPSRRRKP